MTVLHSAIPILSKANAIVQVLNGIRAAVAYLERRGVSRDAMNELLTRAEAEGRDLTQAEVAEKLAEAQDAIDALNAAAAEAKALEDKAMEDRATENMRIAKESDT